MADWDPISTAPAPTTPDPTAASPPAAPVAPPATDESDWAAISHAPAPPPAQTGGGLLQAVGTIPGKLATDIAGMGVDTMSAVENLAKASYAGDKMLHDTFGEKQPAPGETLTDDGRATITPGGLYHFTLNGVERFSKSPPPAGAKAILQPAPYKGDLPDVDTHPEDQVGSSEWNKQQLRNLGASGLVDVKEQTALNREVAAGGEGLAFGLTGNEAGATGALRAGAAGATAGAVGQQLTDRGVNPGVSGALSLVAGHLVGNMRSKSSTGQFPPIPENPTAPEDHAVTLLNTPDEPAAPKTTGDSSPNAPEAPEPPVAPQKSSQAVAHVADPDNGSHTFEVPGKGLITAQETDTRTGPALQIKRSDVSLAERGQGYGTAMYAAAADHALASGQQLVSDVSVSPTAAAVYKNLQEQGYTVVQNPSERSETTGNLVSTDPRTPVFSVTAGPKVQAAPLPAPTPLRGMATTANVNGQPVEFGPNPVVKQAAANYAKSVGLKYDPPRDYVPIDSQHGVDVANAYDAMAHTPTDPATLLSYNALVRETRAQWDAIQKTGLKVNFIKPGADPYAANPRLAIMDVKNNNHLWAFPTEAGFGSGDKTNSNHPLLKPSGVTIDGKATTNNDLFRIVHDYFGHAAEGNGFRAAGEYNAWRQHAALYSPEAQGALASETLGQNAWVNFGPHGAQNKAASGDKTTYADQKAGLMPAHLWNRSATVRGQNRVAQSIFAAPAQEGIAQAAKSPDEQAARVATFKRLGMKEVRGSAITGDSRQAGTEFQTSQLTGNPAGDRLANVIDAEREAIRKNAQDLITDSGGSAGMNQPDLYRRGKTMTAPIEEYHQHLEEAMGRAYKLAKLRTQNQPIQLPGLQGFLTNSRSQFLNTTEGKQLLEGLTARMDELGLNGANKTFNPATVEQAEMLRQYMGESWTPRTNKLLGQLKGTLDADVTKAAGEDVFKDARAIRTVMAKTLEEPELVSSLLNTREANKAAVNRAVDFEDAPTKIVTAPHDQLQQYISVLKQAARSTPELANKAVNALHEVRAQFANEYFQAGDSNKGMWNQKAANAYLRNNEKSMQLVYSPQEMIKFQDNDNAARWLHMDRRYPGASAQGHNLLAAGALKAAEHAPEVGALTHHAIGWAAGVGAKAIAGKIAGKSQLNRTESLIQDLDDWKPPAKAPERVAPIGAVPAAQRGGPKMEQLQFRHFSNLDADKVVLDPEKYGSGIAGAERSRVAAGAPKTVSLYGIDHPDKDIEPGLKGKTEYKVSLPRSGMYDLSKDSRGLIAKSQEENGGTYDHTEVERTLKALGYRGYYLPTGDGNFRGQGRLFTKTPAIKAGKTRH